MINFARKRVGGSCHHHDTCARARFATNRATPWTHRGSKYQAHNLSLTQAVVASQVDLLSKGSGDINGEEEARTLKHSLDTSSSLWYSRIVFSPNSPTHPPPLPPPLDFPGRLVPPPAGPMAPTAPHQRFRRTTPPPPAPFPPPADAAHRRFSVHPPRILSVHSTLDLRPRVRPQPRSRIAAHQRFSVHSRQILSVLSAGSCQIFPADPFPSTGNPCLAEACAPACGPGSKGVLGAVAHVSQILAKVPIFFVNLVLTDVQFK